MTKVKTTYTLEIRNPKGKLIYRLHDSKHTANEMIAICDQFWETVQQ